MSTMPKTQPEALAEAGSGQYLIFNLASEEYGVDILKVQEIRGWTAVTRVPHTPSYVQGVFNLRGTIVPIIDLRQRLGMPKIEYTASTVVIVLSIHAQPGRRVLGIVVDGVSDVLNIPAEAIRPPPDLGTAIRSEFLSGMATLDKRMLVLLDLDKLLTAEEIGQLDTAANASGQKD